MQNIMSVLRHVLRFGGSRGAISKDNAKYGIERRRYITNKDKSEKLTEENISKLNNKYVHMSLIFQNLFMLRPGESMKIPPGKAHVVDKDENQS